MPTSTLRSEGGTCEPWRYVAGDHLNQSTRKFLSDEMGIELKSVDAKLNSVGVIDSAESICSYVNVICKKYISQTESNLIEEDVLSEFERREGLMVTGEAHEVLDCFRHAFSMFLDRNIKDLFFYQENEGWYPKVILSGLVDISELSEFPDSLEIYRGCDETELNQRQFGQSWTLNRNVAEIFAYYHYRHQSWFELESRIVIQATIPKASVYLSRLSHYEQEIVVNTHHLSNIRKCT